FLLHFLRNGKSSKTGCSLSLEYGDFTSLPECIGELKSLEFLNIRGNILRDLPESIGNLQNLQYIDARDNMLESLPDSICDLKLLEDINIENNPKWNWNYIPKHIRKLLE
ncbi:MAG: hypothetical protein RM368_12185, partial [Nostoc sp. DedSLP03]|nr:hypothetical protein [Nostoc sp. DedSLP03]